MATSTSAPTAGMTDAETGASSTAMTTDSASETGVPTSSGTATGSTVEPGTSTSSETGPESTSETIEPSSSGSSGSPELPPTECGDMMCQPGEFCSLQEDACIELPAEICEVYETGTTGEPEDYNCWDTMNVFSCHPIPLDCFDDPRGVEACIEAQFDNPCNLYGEFYDGVLVCEDYDCGNVAPDDFVYCKPCP